MRKEALPLRLTNDLVFFFVYASDTEDSRKALIAMLNLVLDRKDDPITQVTVVNGVHKGFKLSDKGTIMDIRAVTISGEQFDIEMQNKVEADFVNRTLLYGCRMVNSSLYSGEYYDKMEKSIVISFINGIQFTDIPQLHTRFLMTESSCGRCLTDRLEIHFFELGKVPNLEPCQMTPLEQFCAYLKYAGDETMEDYVSKLLKTGEEAIDMSAHVYYDVTSDEELEILLWHQQMYEWDRITELHRAEQKGLERGIAALIRALCGIGMSEAQILEKLRQSFDITEKQAKKYYQDYAQIEQG